MLSMQFDDYLRLGIAAGLFAFQIFLWKSEVSEKKRKCIFKILFFGAIAAVFGYCLYISITQYSVWADGFYSYLPPTVNPLNHFIPYILIHYWATFLISLILGVLGFYSANYANKKYGERFFEPEEPFLILTAIFLTGHPAWIAFVILLLLAALLFSVLNSIKRRGERFSLYWLWLPLAFFTIIISSWLFVNFQWLSVLKLGTI
ncbi:MAG: hypothetical protein PHP03_01120 [Candidatus Pacebacteria bacterium]|nr:hypothetical protein [Candidatus Paceibacterota bacterium]